MRAGSEMDGGDDGIYLVDGHLPDPRKLIEHLRFLI